MILLHNPEHTSVCPQSDQNYEITIPLRICNQQNNIVSIKLY